MADKAKAKERKIVKSVNLEPSLIREIEAAIARERATNAEITWNAWARRALREAAGRAVRAGRQ